MNTFINRSDFISIITGLIFLAITFLLAFPDVKMDHYFTNEDSWVENFTALAFLFSSIVFFKTFWSSRDENPILGKITRNRNLVYLLLGLLFFVAFGEEISWGQRIFNWSTPEALAKINYQKETNIHNLDFFTFKDEVDDSFWSFLFVLNAGRLFFYFWFLYMVLLPGLSIISKRFHLFLKKKSIPVPSLWIGLLMISNLLIAKFYKLYTSDFAGDYSGSIDEIQEGNYALLIAVLSVHLYKKSASTEANYTNLDSLVLNKDH